MEAEYDVIILGAGAAGLSACLYTSRAMMKTLVLESLGSGGQLLITDEIENYPGFPEGVNGPKLAQDMETQALRFGGELEYAEVEGLDDMDKPVKVVRTSDRD
ncbi:MAG: FAD-binding protein, partial [Chloroflexi bacterium]|nr:FAD-binding protein [Chloroflexota bacterium]